MKKLKKLLSVVLAGAMALSLCATALASTASGDPAANPPASTVSGDTATTVSGDKVGSGAIDARSVSQGAVPAKPISVILPVIPTRTNGKAQLFDFILDPHQLIAATDGAKYLSVLSGLGDADKLFDPDSRLYFASKTGDEYLYSGSSKVLTVTNTGFVPVDVDLDLEFSRGDADFDLVSGDSLLSGGLLARPQMYLAVVASGKTGPITKPIEDPADDAVPTVKYTSTNEYLVKTTDVPNAIFEYTSDYDTGDTSTTSGDSIALDNALEQVKITLTFTPHANGADNENGTADDGVAYLAVAVTGVPTGLASAVVDTNGNAFSVSSGGAITADIDDAVSEDDDGAKVVVQIGTENNGAFGDALAEITFAVTVSADPDEPAGTQTISLRKPHTGAMLETALDVLEGSYKLAHTTDSAKMTELHNQGVAYTTAGYYWEKQQLNDALYPAFSFHLEGNINEANRDDDAMVSPWDDIDADSNVKFDMTWDVTPYSKYADRVKLTDPAEDAGPVEPVVEDVAPTVEVTTRATGTTSSTKTATLTWTEGTGAYEGYEPVSASNSKGSFTGTAFSVTGNTIKLLASSTLKADTNCVITFSDGTDTYDVDVTGWFGTN